MEFPFCRTMTFPATPSDNSDGKARRDYIVTFLHAQGASLSPVQIEALITHAEEPSLVDRNALLTACSPLGEDIAARMEWQIIQAMEREWYVPPGEHIVEIKVAVLAVDYFGCHRGNLAVIRRTDQATIVFLLPQLEVDVKTLQLRSKPSGRPRLTAAAEGGDLAFEEGLRTSLETLGTLAFALPEPWGVITSAGLGLIAAFLPDSRPNPFGQLAEKLEKFENHATLSAIAKDGSALSSWIKQTLAAWDKTGVSGGKEMLGQIKEWEGDLQKFLIGGRGTLYNDLQQLQSSGLSNEESALLIYVLSVTALLAGMKFDIILKGLEASIHKEDGDIDSFNDAAFKWRIAYNSMVIQVLGDKKTGIVGCAAITDNWMSRQVSDRFSKISAVARFDYSFPPDHVSKYGPPVMGPTYDGYRWEDQADGGMRSYYPDRHCNWTGADCTYQSYHEQAVQEHDAHVAAVREQLLGASGKYTILTKTIRGWQDMMLEWSNNMPPGPAKATPIVESWTPGTDSPWKDHTSVQYAVAFGNDKGPGDMSSWSATETINGINAKVTIPVDDMRQATKRWVFRRFDGKSETLQCAFIMGNTTVSFVDDAQVKWVKWKLAKK